LIYNFIVGIAIRLVKAEVAQGENRARAFHLAAAVYCLYSCGSITTHH
jgi:hypothetical protein